MFSISGNQAKLNPRERWRIIIDGIEGFPGYITPVHDYIYNRIFLGDALELLGGLPDNTYELVLAIDILEHFFYQEGILFINELIRVSGKHVLISTPKNFIAQEYEANPYENHRSLWGFQDLRARGFDEYLDNEENWIAVFHKETSWQ